MTCAALKVPRNPGTGRAQNVDVHMVHMQNCYHPDIDLISTWVNTPPLPSYQRMTHLRVKKTRKTVIISLFIGPQDLNCTYLVTHVLHTFC
eukprot:SAG11_NODE_3745_length_2253_cov_9.767874_3_plen_91_part_00